MVRVVSVTGGVRFDRAATANAVRELGDPPLIAELDARDGFAPALRLPWPLPPDEDPLPAGFDTEVRLTLRPDVDHDVLWTGWSPRPRRASSGRSPTWPN